MDMTTPEEILKDYQVQGTDDFGQDTYGRDQVLHAMRELEKQIREEYGELKQSPRWVKAELKDVEKWDSRSVVRFCHTKLVLHEPKHFVEQYPHRINTLEFLDESESPKEEAVEFAEWIRDNDYSQSNRSGGEWYDPTVGDSDVVYYTTQELYNLFRQTK